MQFHRTASSTNFTFISSRLAGRGPGLPTAALLFCRISPPEPEDTEEALLTVAERLRTAGALAPLCCSPGGLQRKRSHRHQNRGGKALEALSAREANQEDLGIYVNNHTRSETQVPPQT